MSAAGISTRGVGMHSKIPAGESFPLAPRKVPTKQAATKKAPVKKAAVKKAAVKKAVVKKTPAKKIAKAPAAKPMWQEAVAAAEEKQAQNIRVLDLRDVTSFADYFIICNGTNIRQNQAISDEIEVSLKKLGEYPNSIEGYDNAEWVLLDYGDYLVHIFTEKSRAYYDLERLWRDAKVVDLAKV